MLLKTFHSALVSVNVKNQDFVNRIKNILIGGIKKLVNNYSEPRSISFRKVSSGINQVLENCIEYVTYIIKLEISMLITRKEYVLSIV